MSDTLVTMTAHPPVDYAHLPGEEHNPIMESSLHAQWVVALVGAATTTLNGTGHLVTGNVPFDAGDGGPYLAPDLMVVPGAEGEQFRLSQRAALAEAELARFRRLGDDERA